MHKSTAFHQRIIHGAIAAGRVLDEEHHVRRVVKKLFQHLRAQRTGQHGVLALSLFHCAHFNITSANSHQDCVHKSCAFMRSLVAFLLTTALHASAAEPRRPHLQIINGSGQTVDSFWLKSDTERVANGTIAPGKETIITTTLGHRFAFVGRDDKLETIVTSEVPVPAQAVTESQKVPLYFSPSYQGKRGRAEFHPGNGWLKDNGRDPNMVKGVEVSGIADFEAEVNRMLEKQWGIKP